MVLAEVSRYLEQSRGEARQQNLQPKSLTHSGSDVSAPPYPFKVSLETLDTGVVDIMIDDLTCAVPGSLDPSNLVPLHSTLLRSGTYSPERLPSEE